MVNIYHFRHISPLALSHAPKSVLGSIFGWKERHWILRNAICLSTVVVLPSKKKLQNKQNTERFSSRNIALESESKRNFPPVRNKKSSKQGRKGFLSDTEVKNWIRLGAHRKNHAEVNVNSINQRDWSEARPESAGKLCRKGGNVVEEVQPNIPPKSFTWKT